MAKNENQKKGIFDVFISILGNFKDFPIHYKFNIISGIIIAATAIVLAIPPVLSLVDNIVISIGNIFIAIFSERDFLPLNNSSTFISAVIAFAILFLEMQICKWFSAKATKINEK